MKIRVRFSKTGNMKYIGHLDVMRYFQKAVKRAGIDIAFTEGFSPHPVMSFALPLGVGITSEGEYMDIRVNSTKSTKEAVSALNSVMCQGFSVSDYRQLPDDAKKGMTLVFAADYTISLNERSEFCPSKELWEGIEKDFWEKQEIIDIYRGFDAPLIFTSARENINVDAVKELLKGKTTAVAGPSGVGKSTLINAIIGSDIMEIGDISKKTLRGKHTTRHTEMFEFDVEGEDSFILDTPGFSSFYLPTLHEQERASD